MVLRKLYALWFLIFPEPDRAPSNFKEANLHCHAYGFGIQSEEQEGLHYGLCGMLIANHRVHLARRHIYRTVDKFWIPCWLHW